MGRTHTVVAGVRVIEDAEGVFHGVALVDKLCQPTPEQKKGIDVIQD